MPVNKSGVNIAPGSFIVMQQICFVAKMTETSAAPYKRVFLR
jgi:hypothetical protein